MYATLAFIAVVGLASASPIAAPQGILFDSYDTAIFPTVTTPPLGVSSDPPTYNSTAADVAAKDNPVTTDVPLARRDACDPEPAGSGPGTTPDTASAFLANPVYTNESDAAPVPDGYNLTVSNLQAATEAPTYLGFYTLDSYDTIKCQEHCDSTDTCESFNLYIERDPSLTPGDGCPNPNSTVNYKCSLFGSTIDNTTATNTGQWRDEFQVVITGSNIYNKLAPPPPVANFTGCVEFGGAINAPVGPTYIGERFFPGPYDPGQCAAACQATTTYDSNHPNSDGTFSTCAFFNSYVLSKNYVPQGTYCALYTQPYGEEYATNYGQFRGQDDYTVSQSCGYTLDACE